MPEVTVKASRAGAHVVLSMKLKTNKHFLVNLHEIEKLSNFLPTITEEKGRHRCEIKVDMDVRSLPQPIYISMPPIIFPHILLF